MSKILGNVEELNATVNVAKYGAVGDGITDDTTAIQAALSDTTAKIIEFSPGKTYLNRGGLDFIGADRTIIATNATLKLHPVPVETWMIQLQASRQTIIGGTWDGNRDNQSAGDAFSSYGIGVFADYATVKNARLTEWRGTGIKNTNGSYCVVDGCQFDEIGNGNATCYGVYMESLASDDFGNEVRNSTFYFAGSGTSAQPILFTSVTVSTYDWEISGNYIEGSTSVSNADQAICMAVRGARGRVINNYTTGGSMGWSEGGDDTIISNNTIMSTTGTVRWGIEPSGSRMVISNNFVRNHARCITGSFTNDDLTINGNYLETDNTFTSISLGGPTSISFVPATSKTCVRMNITGNTLRSKVGITAGKDSSNWNIVGNDFIGPGSTTSGSRGIYTDTITSTSLKFNIASNKFNGFERAMGIYSSTSTTYTDISFNSNNCQNDVAGGSATLVNDEGSAVLGDRILQWGNQINTTGTNFRYYFDRANARGVEYSNSFATPEGNVSAGIGSQYYNTAGSGGTSLYIKESGTSTTGWTKIGSTQHFADGTASAPSIAQKTNTDTGMYFPANKTIGFTANSVQVSTFTDSTINFNLDSIRIVSSKSPAAVGDPGLTGQICWDASYIYVCTGTNTWRRVAINSW